MWQREVRREVKRGARERISFTDDLYDIPPPKWAGDEEKSVLVLVRPSILVIFVAVVVVR